MADESILNAQSTSDFWKQRQNTFQELDPASKVNNTQEMNAGLGPLDGQDAQVQANQVATNPESLNAPVTAATNQLVLQGMTDTGKRKAGDADSVETEIGKKLAVQQQVQQPQTVQPTSQLSESMDPRNSAFNMYEGAVQSQLKAAQNSALAQEAFFTEKSKIDEAKKIEMDAKQASFDMDWDKKTKDYENTLEEMKAASNDKVIPGAFLARQDTSGALATGIAVALGAFAATASGTTSNLGIEMINKAIDRDIDAQKFNIENKFKNKKAELDSQNTLLGRMREKYTDDKSAILATRALMLDSVESKMKLQLAKTSLPLEAQAKAQEQMANIKMKRIESLSELKAAQMQLMAQNQADDGNLTREQALERYGKEGAEYYVQGLGPAHSAEHAKIGYEKILPAKATLAKLDGIINQYNSDEYKKLSPNQRKLMDARIVDMQLELKEWYKLGVLTGPDMGLLIELTGNPNDIFTLVDPIGRLKQLKSGVEGDFGVKVKTYFPNSALYNNRQSAKSALKYSK